MSGGSDTKKTGSRRFAKSVTVFAASLLFCLISDPRPLHAVTSVDPHFALTDETGKPVTDHTYDGYLRLVFFGYTNCPDICPTTLAEIALVLDELGDLGAQVRALFVSLDPKRDTPAVLANYTDNFHPAIIGLSGPPDEIARMARGFGVEYGYNMKINGKERDVGLSDYRSLSATDAYYVYHPIGIYLLDRQGRFLNLFGWKSKNRIVKKIRDYLSKKNR